VNSLVLATASRFLITLLLLFAVFLLIRGHNEPGGGFIAGLVVAAALALYTFANGTQAARDLLRVDPLLLIGSGLAIALLSAVPGVVEGDSPLTGVWRDSPLPGGTEVKLGSPLLFDLGVFLAVVGSAASVVLRLAEEA
jgi:multicomponent Na+:H+ antiporter subunit B